MSKRILVLQGHPDPAPDRFGRALADAYAAGAEAAGHAVRRLDVAALALPPLGSQVEWMAPSPLAGVAAAQADIEWAEHLLLLYPLWLGDVPAALKAFLEQVLRPGFAFERDAQGRVGKPRLKGRSARIVVTMGMPGFFYRWFYRAHSLKSLQRNVLKFCGFRPVRSTLVGMVEGNPERRGHWLEAMRRLGEDAI